MRILTAFIGAVTGTTAGAILGGVAFYIQDAMGHGRHMLFSPALGVFLGVFVLGLLGGAVGIIVGIGLLNRSTGAIVGLMLGIGALVWQRHYVVSSELPPLIVLTVLLGLPLIGILVSIVVDRFHSNRKLRLRTR